MANPIHQEAIAQTTCRTIGRRRRFPNVMPDVRSFLDRWNRPGAARSAARLHTSRYGNINTVGLPGIHEADDLDPAHPAWPTGIEDGVRALVTTLTSGAWELVTYDSCRGHFYDTATELEPTTRQVGILPRDRAEWHATATALCRAVTAAQPAIPPSIQLSLNGSALECGRTGDTYEVLDLSFDPTAGTTWERYFADIDAATEVFAAVLAAQSPTVGVPCACTAP